MDIIDVLGFVIIMGICLTGAIVGLSDRVSGKRNIGNAKTIIAILIGIACSIAIATAIGNCLPNLKIEQNYLVGILIFCIYLTISFGIGVHKANEYICAREGEDKTFNQHTVNTNEDRKQISGKQKIFVDVKIAEKLEKTIEERNSARKTTKALKEISCSDESVQAIIRKEELISGYKFAYSLGILKVYFDTLRYEKRIEDIIKRLDF